MVEAVDRGQSCFDRREWSDAFDELSVADRQSQLVAEDLERLAMVAYLVGREGDAEEVWARAHQASLRCGETARAVRCAFWLGLALRQRGETTISGGWLARVRRLVEHSGAASVERAYLLEWEANDALFAGDDATAYASYERAAKIAALCDDPDLSVLSRMGRGQSLVHLGETVEGMALLDDVMVAVTAGEASPILAGLAYCIVIKESREAFDLRRSQEWTAALSRWCDAQAGLVAYRGHCLVHRAEVMRLGGDWPEAMEAAQRARAQLSDPPNQPAVAMACYELAEQHRLRGELAKAEEGYRQADRWGHDPQPGLALLRLGQGQVDAAAATIRRVVEESAGRPVPRVDVLAAAVEILLAVDDVDAARRCADQLAAIVADLDAPWPHAMAAGAIGAVLLAEGDATAALGVLRRAWTAWHELQAPYEAARTRVLVAHACRALGDDDTAEMELAAARAVFQGLGAATDVARLDELSGAAAPARTGGLTGRELQVLALVAKGNRNRAIAAELVISEKTVARHVSNIFTKLGVSSRSAATAFAYRHGLAGCLV